MTEQERKPLRGIDLRALGIEQVLESSEDKSIFYRSAVLLVDDPSARMIVRLAHDISQLPSDLREAQIEKLTKKTYEGFPNAVVEHNLRELIAFSSMKPAILDKLVQALDIIYPFEGGENDSSNRT